MSHRTTILLDDETRKAARDLAHRLDCSTSEAIRQAILRFRDATAGVPVERQKQRVDALNRLFELFEGHDVEDEIARLKAEDDGF